MCPPGHYCPTGSYTKRPCASGTYQNEWGRWTCKTCPAGYFCNATHGPVSLFGSYECPQGFYCPAGTKFATEYPCGLGTFLNRTKGESSADCIPCIGKFICDSTGLANPWRLCSSGYYCRRGVNSSTPRAGVDGDQCPPGRYCPEGMYDLHTDTSFVDIGTVRAEMLILKVQTYLPIRTRALAFCLKLIP